MNFRRVACRISAATSRTVPLKHEGSAQSLARFSIRLVHGGLRKKKLRLPGLRSQPVPN